MPKIQNDGGESEIRRIRERIDHWKRIDEKGIPDPFFGIIMSEIDRKLVDLEGVSVRNRTVKQAKIDRFDRIVDRIVKWR